MPDETIIIGHRGSIDHPENTLRAVEAALDAGASGVEVDVQRTLDGRLVLSHDQSLQRMAGTDLDLRTTGFADLHHVRIQGEPIALLRDALDLVKSRGGFIDVEVKHPDDFEAVCQAVIASGLRDVIVSSFWHQGVAGLKESFPGIKTAYIYSHYPKDISRYAKEVDFLKPHYSYLEAGHAEGTSAEAAHKGAQYEKLASRTIPWTVNNPEAVGRLVRMGVFGVITDMPAMGVSVRAQVRSEIQAMVQARGRTGLGGAGSRAGAGAGDGAEAGTGDGAGSRAGAGAGFVETEVDNGMAMDSMYMRMFLSMVDKQSVSINDNVISLEVVNNIFPLTIESAQMRDGLIEISEPLPFLWNVGNRVRFRVTVQGEAPMLTIGVREAGTVNIPVNDLALYLQ